MSLIHQSAVGVKVDLPIIADLPQDQCFAVILLEANMVILLEANRPHA